MSQIRKGTIADFLVTGEGSGTTVYLLHPLTESAYEWVAEHIPEDARRLGNAIAVEHRFIRDIVDGARSDGLADR